MKKSLSLSALALILIISPGFLLAQDFDYHPYLSDTFSFSLGAMRSSNSFKLKADLGGDIGDEIDFGDALGVSKHSTFFNGQLKWKIGSTKKWSIAAQYFSNNAKGSNVLTEDVEWDGMTWKEGSFVDAGVKLSVARLFVGRSLFKNERNDFGIGAGIHVLKMKAFIEGNWKILRLPEPFGTGNWQLYNM